jgi:5-methylcytosine-specific restriction endonuclease McrA
MNNKSWKMKNPDARAMIQARSYQKNKSKRQSYMAKYRRDNPEKIRTYISKRRAQMSDSSTWMVTEKDLSKMLNKPCSYCQIRSAVHIDHIIPLSKGGNHSVGNLTGACRGCNLSKGSMFVMEWRRRRERMDINLLAKEMRDRALLIEGDESLDETSLRSFAVVNQERQKKRQRLEDMKKLYFNAGRWVGGARDQSARESFIRMREYEARESR